MLKFPLLQWRTTIIFLMVATLFVLSATGLTRLGILPITANFDYTNAERQFLRVWIWIALMGGLVLPLVAYWRYRRDRQIRRVLGLYLLVLIVQIITEQLVSLLLFPTMVAVIGTLYSLYRIAQLWQGYQWMQRYRKRDGSRSTMAVFGLLWGLLLFWSSNLAIILGISFPAIVLP
jgi:hypothetical protein